MPHPCVTVVGSGPSKRQPIGSRMPPLDAVLRLHWSQARRREAQIVQSRLTLEGSSPRITGSEVCLAANLGEVGLNIELLCRESSSACTAGIRAEPLPERMRGRRVVKPGRTFVRIRTNGR